MNNTKIVARVADDTEKPNRKKVLTFLDLKPLECFVSKDGCPEKVRMRVDTGYIWLHNGDYQPTTGSCFKQDPIFRAIPRNPFEFDIIDE